MAEKIKLLGWMDYCVSTGFGTVSGNIMRELAKTGRYEIDVVGVNYTGDPYDHDKWPGDVWPALSSVNTVSPYGDVFGRQRVLDLLAKKDYDVLFLLNDTFVTGQNGFIEAIVESQKHARFKTVYYIPLDATPNDDWIKGVVAETDFPVAYTNWGHSEIAAIDPETAKRTKVIYHGTNLEDFHYIEDRKSVEQFRHDWFKGEMDGKYLIANVNRNQARKDIARSMMILKELMKTHDDTYLYLHMQAHDVGGNLQTMARQIGVASRILFPHPEVFNTNQGIPVETLNWLYNTSDVVLTTTLGEGWGLAVTEAMATRTPVVAPNHTSLTEMLADNRGILVPAGNTPSHWIVKEMDNDRIRPLMDVQLAAQAITDLRSGKNVPSLDKAQAFTRQYSWGNVAKSWLEIIDEAAKVARTPIVEGPEILNRQQRRALAKQKR